MNWRRKPIWVFLTWFLTIASFVWVFFILNEGIGEVVAGKIHTEALFTLIAWIFLTASIIVNISAFSVFMNKLGSSSFSFLEIGELHITGQLIRHLPGRFFGVIYQAAKAKHIASTAQWVSGNISILIMSTWVGITLALSVMTTYETYGHWAASALVLIVFITLTLFAFSKKMNFQFKNKFIQHVVQILNSTSNVLFSKTGAYGLIFVFLSWLIYGGAWIFLVLSVNLPWQDGLVLGALYTLAWAVGYFSLLTPGGLGVRELVFALLTSTYSPELITYFAVILRVGMIVSEASLSLIFLFLLKIIKNDKNNLKSDVI